MGANSNIEWTHHTWNWAVGCEKVDTDCKYCYMFREVERFGGDPTAVRRTKDLSFYLPAARDREGRYKLKSGELVFTLSMGDFFHEACDAWRPEVWQIMRCRPDLFYIVLTKRPERVIECLPDNWGDGWPNVALVMSAGTQRTLEERWKWFKDVPAKVRGLSLEPLLEPVTLNRILGLRPGYEWRGCVCEEIHPEERPCIVCCGRVALARESGLDWVIAGMESGPKARPVPVRAFVELLLECDRVGIPFFLKQLCTNGRKVPYESIVPRLLRRREYPKLWEGMIANVRDQVQTSR